MAEYEGRLLTMLARSLAVPSRVRHQFPNVSLRLQRVYTCISLELEQKRPAVTLDMGMLPHDTHDHLQVTVTSTHDTASRPRSSTPLKWRK